jgi:hypothetical protein
MPHYSDTIERNPYNLNNWHISQPQGGHYTFRKSYIPLPSYGLTAYEHTEDHITPNGPMPPYYAHNHTGQLDATKAETTCFTSVILTWIGEGPPPTELYVVKVMEAKAATKGVIVNQTVSVDGGASTQSLQEADHNIKVVRSRKLNKHSVSGGTLELTFSGQATAEAYGINNESGTEVTFAFGLKGARISPTLNSYRKEGVSSRVANDPADKRNDLVILSAPGGGRATSWYNRELTGTTIFASWSNPFHEWQVGSRTYTDDFLHEYEQAFLDESFQTYELVGMIKYGGQVRSVKLKVTDDPDDVVEDTFTAHIHAVIEKFVIISSSTSDWKIIHATSLSPGIHSGQTAQCGNEFMELISSSLSYIWPIAGATSGYGPAIAAALEIADKIIPRDDKFTVTFDLAFDNPQSSFQGLKTSDKTEWLLVEGRRIGKERTKLFKCDQYDINGYVGELPFNVKLWSNLDTAGKFVKIDNSSFWRRPL